VANLRLRAAAQLELLRRDRIRYQQDPAAFARERLGLTLTPDQIAILESVRDNPRTFVKAGNGTGKTFISSVVVAWTMECFEPAEVITSGPSFDQIKDALWKEIRLRHEDAVPKLRGHLLPKDPRWEVEDDHFAVGRTADKEEGFKGKHSRGRLLIVLDEGPGVPEYIYTAANTMLQGGNARLLTIGNPTVISGSFFEAFNSKSEINATLTMSPIRHPNVLAALDHLGITWDEFIAARFGTYKLADGWQDPFPGAISLPTIDLFKVEFGVGTPSWDSIVEGQFPSAGDRALVSLEWLDRARQGASTEATTALPKRLSVPTGKWAGLDVARFGDDRCALIRVDGQSVVSVETWMGRELSYTAGRAVEAVREGYVVNLDEGGLGAGITSHLKEDGLREGVDFRPNNAGSSPEDKERFGKMRDQLWFDTADLLRAGVIDLSQLPETDYRTIRSELTAALYDIDSSGRRKVESKDAMKKRIKKSPDVADALNLALWRRPKRRARFAGRAELEAEIEAERRQVS
jgi:hypothetical protein